MTNKFRAWDRKEKKMICPALVIRNMGFGDGSVVVNTDARKGNELDWMQYTGLKDKNGKEIIESDLVKDDYGHTLLVEWRNGGFVATLDSLEVEGQELQGVYEENKTSFEVIGNIYNNPELIK